MKIGSFDTSSITSPLSDAVSSVEKKVEAKIDSAVNTVKQAESKVENFAKSEYQEVKDFAKVTGQKIEQKFEGAVDTVKHAAHDLPSFKVPQGVKDLGKKVFGGPAPTKGTEGGGDLSRINGGDRQKDASSDTTSDGSRCQSNTMIAGLLMKGGPDAVKAGLAQALEKAKQEQSSETDPNRKKALDKAVTNLQSAIDGIGAKNVTRGQLDKAAEALFVVMTPAKEAPNKAGVAHANYDANGDITSGTPGADKSKIAEMEKKVGLTDGSGATPVGEKWFAPLTDDNREVSDNVWDRIQPGKTAHVGVNLYGEHKVTGIGPDGKPITINSRNDQPYSADGELLNKSANHAVLFGKNADGTRFIYNPIGDPPYMSEKPGDKESSRKLDEMSTALMGVKPGKEAKSNDWQADVTNY